MTNSRKKGYLGELAWRKLCESKGLDVITHNEDPNLPDATIEGRTCEIKVGKAVPKKIYDWLEQDGADFAAARKDRKDWLVVMKAEDFFKLLNERK